ncbi:putative transposase YbfD/YdcC [Streptomyces zagrosensis]|uniref:Putative transposase YbfD/YdcC n=1 Tax=Streptomyces zagrosensis TaxID=1042984 RepID=A0A7W9V2F3_9ACTN|nr:putative transposase YbfD/YdcC [Streptomyces zagrosensis]
MSVLLVACSAVVAGARSFAAIGQWARSAPQAALARLGARTVSVFGVRLAPSMATIGRFIDQVCPGDLADLLECAPVGADTLAVDGQERPRSAPWRHSGRASARGDHRHRDDRHQLRVPAKTNEITCFTALLAPYDLTGVVVTADALHTQRDLARFLVEDKKAHYAFTVKGNQKGLHHQLRALPWTKASAKFPDRTKGHGRLETQVVQALTVSGLGMDFPHAAQVAKITRHRTNSKRTRETVYGITDLTSRQASPERLATIARSQWTIENRLHFVRDTTFAEDASEIRTEHGPKNMATLRSFAINLLRAAGHTNVAAALREMSYEPFRRPLDLLGIN